MSPTKTTTAKNPPLPSPPVLVRQTASGYESAGLTSILKRETNTTNDETKEEEKEDDEDTKQQDDYDYDDDPMICD
jgi:hypothetical protein